MKKKRKKLNGVEAVADAVKNESVPMLMKAGAGLVGLLGSGIGGSYIPDVKAAEQVPVIGPYLAKSLPGVGLIIVATATAALSKDERVQAAALGFAIGGAVDIVRRNGVLTKINAKANTGFNGFNGANDLDFGFESNLLGLGDPLDSMRVLGNVPAESPLLLDQSLAI